MEESEIKKRLLELHRLSVEPPCDLIEVSGLIARLGQETADYCKEKEMGRGGVTQSIGDAFNSLVCRSFEQQRLITFEYLFYILCGVRGNEDTHAVLLLKGYSDAGGLEFSTVFETVKKLCDLSFLDNGGYAAIFELSEKLARAASAPLAHVVVNLVHLAMVSREFESLFPLFWILCGRRERGPIREGGVLHAMYTPAMGADWQRGEHSMVKKSYC